MKEIKYKIFTNANSDVIAVSTYAGKTVKGVAKCDPRDTFDMNKGIEIAEARCAKKVADKRLARARKKYAEAEQNFREAEAYLHKMSDYVSDATEAFDKAQDTLYSILERA